MSALRSLRGRVALAATLAVAAVLATVGTVTVASFAQRERAGLDESLRARPFGGIVHALEAPPGGPPHPFEVAPGPLESPGPAPPGHPPDRPLERHVPLHSRGEYVRLVQGGEVLEAVDVPEGLPLPPGPGLHTLEHDGRRHRSLVRPGPGGELLEVGADLRATEGRGARLVRLTLLLGVLGVGVAGALSWWLAGLALRPLRTLRDAAGRVSTTQDLSTRLSPAGLPREVEELSASINAMLARLQRSTGETEAALEATRRFAADAGHELRTPMAALRTRLGALRRNPQLDAPERAAMLAAAEQDAARAANLLETLQTLARGDAAAVLPREHLDLGDLVEAAVEAARARHPATRWALREPAGELAVQGWPDGVRALVDNLLENAARHGGDGGRVEVSLESRDGELALTVDDDGPGVAPADRERIFERFVRAADGGAPGSGLGLALVRQQARLHGGEVTVGEAPLGGARFSVTLPAGDGGSADG